MYTLVCYKFLKSTEGTYVKVYFFPHILATQFPSGEVMGITGFFYVVPEIF